MAALERHDINAPSATLLACTTDNRSSNHPLDHSPAIGDAAALEISARADEISCLFVALDTVSELMNPRTARLLAGGIDKMAQKVIEEAGEVGLAAVHRRARSVVRESADLIYHLVVLWRECGVVPEEIWAEMRRRADLLGIAEKLPKPTDRGSFPNP